MPKPYRPFHASIALSLSLWTGLATPLSVWAETDWYTLKANGQAIGKVGIHSFPAPDNPDNTVTEVSHVNHFSRQGSPFEVNAISRFVESPHTHEAVSFSYRYTLGDEALLEANGQLDEDGIDVRLVRENTASVAQAPIARENFLFPGGEKIKQVYRQHYQDKAGSQFNYQTLHLGVQPQVVNTTVKPLQREKLALATGEVKPVRKFELSNPASKQQKIYEWRDEQGKLYKSQSLGSQSGLEMVYASQREVQAMDRQTVDLIQAATIMSNAIPQPRTTTHALFKLSSIKGETLDLKTLLPNTLYQQVITAPEADFPSDFASIDFSTDPAAVYLRVRQQEPANSLATFPTRFDKRYLQATPYLQVYDPELDQTALRVIGPENRAYYAARKLQQWVYQNIANKDFSVGFATAKETFESKKGDCTEHAVLLTSLLRSAGIPARVAIGLIYLPDEDSDLGKFVFHMWTEAYIGTAQSGDWVALDPTSPEPIPDATHIKLADSALTASEDLLRLTERVSSLMGKIRVDVVQALASAQSVMKVEPKGGVTHLAIEPTDIHRVDIQNLSQQAIQHYRVTPPPKDLSANSAEGLFTRGVEAQAAGKTQQARSYFQQALSKATHPVALFQLGEKLVAVGQYPLAQQAFTQAESKDNALAPLVADWMDTVMPRENLSAAVAESLEQALAGAYQIPQPATCQQIEAFTRQQAASSSAVLYKALGQSCSGPKAMDALRRALALNPQDFQSAELLGDLSLQNQKPDEALKAYQQALNTLSGRAFARSKPWVSTLRGKLWMASAQSRLAKNRRDATGWLLMGKGLMQAQTMSEARQAFQNALTLQPGNTEAILSAYEAALTQLDWDYLDKHFGPIRSLAENNATANRLKAHYLMRKRQYGPALSAAQRAVTLDSHNSQQGRAHHVLYEVYARLADQALWQKPPLSLEKSKSYWQKAEGALKSGIRVTASETGRTALSLALGDYYLNNNQATEALSLAEGVLQSDPLNGKARWIKAQALFLSGNNALARNEARTVLLILPNDPNALATLGQVAEEEGRDAQALDYYQKAYAADSGHYRAATGLRRLMEQLQVNGKKPPALMKLTPDEHDYLVQLFRLKGKISRALILDDEPSLRPLKESSPFNLTLVNSIRDHIQRQGANFQEIGKVYQQIAQLPTPPRFNQLRYHELESQRILLHLINEGLSDNGLFSEATLKKVMTARSQRMAHMAQLDLAQRQALQSIYEHIPQGEFEGVTAEAGWNPLTETLERFKGLQAVSQPLGKPQGKLEKTAQDTKNPNAARKSILPAVLSNP
ncbi:transglutaminase domain-containing protein [Vampirovibrio chlorellavorus]|uniref:transglutaminase domain-containing protein n=1 Tax=Vampirovibrio chlorellavorus TaxID=758823 RepID=UPI0026F026B7|nr:transglutaminase domain-containing protein [Vampirovibrio chlorellavorus]